MNGSQHTPPKKEIWFSAKKYGYGWGRPTCWQGWLVLAIYAALVAAGVVIFSPQRHPGRFGGYLLALSVGMIAVCAWKGEPARWRWGGE
jgi:hypothetical protein